jgi:hypothetical protein
MSGGDLHSAMRISQAEVYCCKSEYVEARNIQHHELHGAAAEQNPYDRAFTLLNLAQIDVEAGESHHSVQQSLDTAGMLFQTLNYPTGLMFCDTIRAALYVQQGKLPAARNLFQNCLRSAWGTKTGYQLTY